VKTYLPWSADLALGIPEIDNQHQLLVAMINRIYDALIHKAPREEAGCLLQELVDYTAVHFALEESLFRITDYPGYDTHKALHEHLKQQVMDTHRRFADGQMNLDLQLMAFLRSWLEDHINGEDRAYVPHMMNTGIRLKDDSRGWLERFLNSMGRKAIA